MRGSFSIASALGHKYFIPFINDCTRINLVYLLKSNSKKSTRVFIPLRTSTCPWIFSFVTKCLIFLGMCLSFLFQGRLVVGKNIHGWKKRDGGFQGGGYLIALDKREISFDLIKEVAFELEEGRDERLAQSTSDSIIPLDDITMPSGLF